jgi:hypothetical protein
MRSLVAAAINSTAHADIASAAASAGGGITS